MLVSSDGMALEYPPKSNRMQNAKISENGFCCRFLKEQRLNRQKTKGRKLSGGPSRGNLRSEPLSTHVELFVDVCKQCNTIQVCREKLRPPELCTAL